MENRQIAERLIELVGGRGNIQSVAHCATRLRIITVDKEQIDMKAVEDLDKVKGSFFNSGQYQIIFGTGLVNKIYDEVQSILGASGGRLPAPRSRRRATASSGRSGSSATYLCPLSRFW